MDVSWRWQLPILLMVICAILGCETSGAQCQDNSRLGNDFIYTKDSVVMGSRINEGIRKDMNALGRLPHDVRCTGHDERSSLGEMEFTNNFNTCPANETVGNLPCDGIISGLTNRFNTCPANETVGNLPCDDITAGGSCQASIESDPGFTFQLKVFGVCFNISVIEVNGEKIDYIEMFEKLNIFVLPDTTTNKTEISESGKIKINFPSNFVAEISENNSRLINVTAVTLTGKCQEFGIRRKVVDTFVYEMFESSRKYTTRLEIPSTSSQNVTIAMYMILSAIVFAILMWLSYSVGFYVGFNQQLQRGAVHVLPAPAG